ncbi:MAG TPA: SRPBCC family protein, partial [Solirubrobacteraceae bacterium]|nr:SRPBCC family protein [Solirubrobacteraceae bacterium]
EITVARPSADVFAYIARAEYLPDYVTDFQSVEQVGGGEPGVGTQYRYKMGRGAEGTFEWTTFEPNSRLAWHGPAVKAGPGSMEPAGSWEFSDASGGGTQVKLIMAPTPGGLFKLLAPFMAAGMRKGNARALERLKARLEEGAGAPTPPAPPPGPAGQSPAPDS